MRLFARASFCGFIGTFAEACTYYVVLWVGSNSEGLYGFASLLGALGGAITNFLLNRYWAFRRTERPIATQAMLYAGASAATYLAVLGGLALLVEIFRVPQGWAYPPAKMIAWLGVSYPLARFIVFGGGGQPE
ncbi:MAG: GtrA family protein [Deltaproteobacteria bacterium]|nr:GtrA family protein [Deltaproteobacteria bacterium]